ncbi:hypothetical protein BJ138DRAFT_1074880 [Hygrophoropsis aurantiaca]|uniref:Uncharacterized protein n=1 Tax=Hygrophoropsis aurantiaca TaxID=72124 RepID=A0ACB8AT49_9AGAM|nr:hypothetical protein BJ138DRAFT_1074880 [Hygrophoropsis aurantiaca]
MLNVFSATCKRTQARRGLRPLRTRNYSQSAISDSASTSINPFPFPTQPHPLPHHIFHLPRNPSRADVKRRYYELVRIYHPDSPVARNYPPEVSQARFQAISKAYDVLRGKSPLTGERLASTKMDPARWATGTSTRSTRPHFDDTSGDERWKERAILAAFILTVGAFFVQTTMTRQQAIAEAVARRRSGPPSTKRAGADDALAES